MHTTTTVTAAPATALHCVSKKKNNILDFCS